ncbi:MAG TPA: L-threonylcarbamoyladenylate synthase [Candidatus Limnocylindrales bacterium]|nr:L-threonylcarbamoyladenylate synthase [Candidatus Limnocylindrales bacterium]
METDPALIDEAVAILRAGGLVAFPTETVYGLGADAANPAAVARIFAAKGRPADHPLIVHLAGAGGIDAWAVDVPPLARALAAACWPGPLTLVLRRAPHVPDAVTGGLPTVGLRVPAHPVALALLRAFAGGIAAPSANRFGTVSPTTAEHVRASLGDAVDLVLDGGPATVGVESTIVDLSGDDPAILRPGGLPRERLEAIAGVRLPVRGTVEDAGVRAPGMLASHYAPDARLLLVRPEEQAARAAALRDRGEVVGVLAFPGSPAVEGAVRVDLGADEEEAARRLYAAIRQLDATCDVILAWPPEERGLGLAIADRLRRAAGARG